MNVSKKGAVSAIIVAAGKGTRAGLGFNKVLATLDGVPILERTIRAFTDSGMIQQIILVINPSDEESVGRIIRRLPYPIECTHGGSQRQESVYNGLKRLSCNADIVLIHDGARPFVDVDIIKRGIESARLYGAACAGMPVKDTIKHVDQEGYILKTPDRSLVWSAQTPQAFSREIIMKAHEHAVLDGVVGTDDAMLAERMGFRVKMFEGSNRNIKITSREDLVWSERMPGNPG